MITVFDTKEDRPSLQKAQELVGGLVEIVRSPVSVPPASGSLVAIEFVIVVEKFASSPNAAASSFNVSSVPGALETNPATSVSTYAFTDC